MRFARNLQRSTGIGLYLPSIMTVVFAISFFLAIARGVHSSTVHAATLREHDPVQLAVNQRAQVPFYLHAAKSAEAITQPPTEIAPSQGTTATNDLFHVAIFRFPTNHINGAMAAFRALASATRREPGNLSYDIYRGINDDQEFYIVEHWASPAALAAHEHTETFIHYGQGMLVKFATLHDTVTARPFDVR